MNKTYVYILKCADNSYYIGHTDHLENRLQDHHSQVYPLCYTAKRLPVELLYTKEFGARDEAFFFERQIKGWSRKKKEALIINDFASLKEYSKKKKQ